MDRFRGGDDGVGQGICPNRLDRSLVRQISCPMRGSTNSYYCHNARTQSLEDQNCGMVGHMVCLDLSGIRAACGYDIQGIIGMPFLQNYVIRIDFDAGKLWFLKTSPEDGGILISRDAAEQTYS